VSLPTTGLRANFQFIYIVTNRHVTESGNSVVRVKPSNGGMDIWELDERKWFFPEDGDDLAATLMSFNPRVIKFNHISISNFLT
jgi:hypothetical protein